MADDLGVQYTDKKVALLEKKINQAYKQAGKEIEEKLQTFTKKSAEREKAYLAKVAAGTMSQDDFDKWKQGQVFYGKAWQSQADGIAKVLADTNKTATAWINNEKADVFAFNGNYTAFDMERGFGVNFGFDLYNEKTVATLLKDNPKILPKSSLNISKDEKWNMRNIRSQVTQGILQGESIPKIANRLATLVPERNADQMVLHARTAMTSAQNGGRQQRYKDAEALGIKFKKVWLATLDSRTRPEHQDADGQAVKPNENFIVGGEEMEYPGDPSADPSMIYNCRCTMVTELEDYPSKFDRRAYKEWVDEDGKEHRESYITKDTTYNEWAKAKQGATNTPIVTYHDFNNNGTLANRYFGERPSRSLRRENPDEYARQLKEYESSMYGSWYNGLSDEQIGSIGNYTGDDYSGINGLLRGEMTENMVKQWDDLSREGYDIKSMIGNIDSAIEQFELKEGITVFRTCDPDVLLASEFNEGSIFTDKAFVSTSALSDKVASGNVVMRINVPAGKGNGAWINPMSGAQDEEYEFLLQRGATFRITGKETVDGDTVISMDMIAVNKGELKYATKQEVLDLWDRKGFEYDEYTASKI